MPELMRAISRKLDLPPLYAIVDPEQMRGRAPADVLSAMLAGGVGIVQLRVKALPTGEFLRLAQQTREQTRSSGCQLVVNDRLDIALACGADGVHLGQEDLPLNAARELIVGKIIGISTHNMEQARQAEHAGADYIGFGPVFETKTKDTGYRSRGLAVLREIRQNIRIPVVAIGGITEENAGQVWEAGADSIAIISDILSARDIAQKVTRILSLHATGAKG